MGKVKWVREKAEVEFDEKRNALKGIGFTQDITKSTLAEEILKQEVLVRLTVKLLDKEIDENMYHHLKRQLME